MKLIDQEFVDPVFAKFEDKKDENINIFEIMEKSEKVIGEVFMSEYIEKLVLLDFIFGSFIHENYILVNRFPFTLPKNMKGHEMGRYYLQNLWAHHRAVYEEMIKNPGDDKNVDFEASEAN